MKKVLTLAISLIAVLGLAFTLNAKVNAVDTTYSYEFTTNPYSDSNSIADLNGIDWGISYEGGTYFGTGNSDKGPQFGSSKKPFTKFELISNSSFDGVTEIKINASGASGTDSKLSIFVGETNVGEQQLSTTAQEYTFAVDNLSGIIKFNFQQTAKAIYIKSIAITYSLGDVESHNVVLMDGTDIISTLEVPDGDNLDGKLNTLTKEGYYFKGWYKDANFVNAWDSSVDTVMGDTTLYAKWEKIVYYTVTLMDGSDTYDSFEVEAGANIADELTYPTKEGYAFGGWYKDAELTVVWNSSDVVTADTTLYAKWNEVNYTKITSIDELVSAQYYIAVYGEESYITNFDSSGWLRVGNIAYALPITIKNEGDYYSLSYIKNGETMYLGHSSNKASEKDECTSNNYKVSSIDYNSGWVIKFADGYIMQYNDNNGSGGFRTYDSIKSNYKLVDLYKINGTEIEETPVVATKFMESETNASLRLFYDAETLVASDVDLRFGVTLSADAYVEGAKYGVIAMPASLGEITSGIQDYTSVEEYLAANPNCTAIAATNIAKVNELGEADEAGSYYQFAWVINNMEGHYSDGIVAVCYMEYEGKLYFNVVKEESVLTVVDKYLALTGLSEEVLTVLENLKNNQ